MRGINPEDEVMTLEEDEDYSHMRGINITSTNFLSSSVKDYSHMRGINGLDFLISNSSM